MEWEPCILPFCGNRPPKTFPSYRRELLDNVASSDDRCCFILLTLRTVLGLWIHTWRSVFVCGKISFILQFPSILIRITFAFIRISSRVNEKNVIRYGILIEMSMLLGDYRPWHFKWIYTIYFHHFNYFELILIEPMQMS